MRPWAAVIVLSPGSLKLQKFITVAQKVHLGFKWLKNDYEHYFCIFLVHLCVCVSSYFSIAMMTKATYTIKSFYGDYNFRRLEYMTIMAGSMTAGGQAGRVLEQVLRAYILRQQPWGR